MVFIGYALLTFFVFNPVVYTTRSLLSAYWFLMFVFFASQTLVMTVYNSWTKLYLRKERHNSAKLSIDDARIKQRNKRAAMTLIWITVVYVSCMLPVAIFYLWLFIALLNFDQNPNHVASAFDKYAIVHSLLPLCSGLNAIVYIVKNPEIKRFYRRIFRRNWNKIQPDGSTRANQTNYDSTNQRSS